MNSAPDYSGAIIDYQNNRLSQKGKPVIRLLKIISRHSAPAGERTWVSEMCAMRNISDPVTHYAGLWRTAMTRVAICRNSPQSSWPKSLRNHDFVVAHRSLYGSGQELNDGTESRTNIE